MDFFDYNQYITINGASRHLEERPGNTHGESGSLLATKQSGNSGGNGWNESNQGYGVKLQKVDNNLVTSYLLGQYKNSLGRNTDYIGAQWQKRFGSDSAHADLGVLAGLATGYNAPVTPMILPTLSLGTNNMDFNVRYAPHIENVTPEVLMFNMDYKLK